MASLVKLVSCSETLKNKRKNEVLKWVLSRIVQIGLKKDEKEVNLYRIN